MGSGWWGEGDPFWRKSQAGLAFLQRAVVVRCPGIVYGIGGAERPLLPQVWCI